MILKISVHDNDFGGVMEWFCKNISTGWHYPKERKPDLDEYKLWCDWNDRYMQDDEFFRRILSEPTQNVSDDNKKRVIQIVTDSFAYFAMRYEKSAEYMKSKFTCEVVDSVTDEWMNGEDYYVFPTSYAGKVLCF